LRLSKVLALTGLSKSFVYGGIRDGVFPPPDVKLGPRAVAWTAGIIAKYQAKRMEEAAQQFVTRK
jgi:predicted DNA-binding transcriptional regulator AlpA